ncbi:SRPBCC family protein [Devosia sp.]|uniref:SRPBCC family protein n=1 Tax=Devosia sp. TaxID=1871048 RepID=UPI002FC5A0D6
MVLKAQTLTVHIARPIAEVYEFLVNPANLGRWTFARDGRHEPAAGLLVWSFAGPEGRVLLHFTRPNPFFVLDYKLSQNDLITHAGYARLIPAGDGTVLTHTAVQQPEVSNAQFASEAEWVMADLLVLKTLMEAK